MTYPDDQACPVAVPATYTEVWYGLTKREWFAGQAMKGYLSGGYAMSLDPPAVAFNALQYADALIAALNRKAKSGEQED